MKKAPWLFVSILSALIVGWFSATSVLMYKVFFDPPQSDRENPQAGKFFDDDIVEATKETDDAIIRLKEKYDAKEVNITTDDGLTLPGYFYINENGTKDTFICVHGYNTNSDFAFAAMVEPILEAGYNCYLINHRHFQGHEGKFTGFGIIEKDELIKWIEKVNEFFPDGQIILYGTSMGAATIMQASDQNSLQPAMTSLTIFSSTLPTFRQSRLLTRSEFLQRRSLTSTSRQPTQEKSSKTQNFLLSLFTAEEITLFRPIWLRSALRLAAARTSDLSFMMTHVTPSRTSNIQNSTKKIYLNSQTELRAELQKTKNKAIKKG